MHSIPKGFCWAIVPIVNFLIFFLIGRLEYPEDYYGEEICPTLPPIILQAPTCPPGMKDINSALFANYSNAIDAVRLPVPNCREKVFANPPGTLKAVNAEKLSQFRNEDLVRMKYPGYATMINAHHPNECTSFVNPTLALLKDCIAVVHARTKRGGHNLLRFDTDPKIRFKMLVTKQGQMRPTGFFKKSGNAKVR